MTSMTSSNPFTRRQLLTGLAALTATGVLGTAGCSSGSGGSSTPSPAGWTLPGPIRITLAFASEAPRAPAETQMAIANFLNIDCSCDLAIPSRCKSRAATPVRVTSA